MIQGTTTPSARNALPAERETKLSICWTNPDARKAMSTQLDAPVTVLGRDPSCAGCLPSSQVSRMHAEVRWIAGVPMIRDLDSTNGVSLNLARITEAPLRAGDVLRLGDWVGVVRAAAVGTPAEWQLEEVTAGYWAGPTSLATFAPARRVARSELPIVIEGETGAGKEGAARAIHLWSGRPGPFFAVNCATLPDSLAEAELFGYRKGAFTGADRMSPGHLRAANGGTLFLDEVVDLPVATQAKLLRAIEQREVHPIGEEHPVRIDVRLLSATQGSLRKAVEEKRFRGDLYSRLDGFTLRLAPLRERAEEVPLLFRKLLEQHGDAAGTRALDASLIEQLCCYDWPFNVRELSLLARQLLVLHPGGNSLDGAMLPERFAARGRGSVGAAGADVARGGTGRSEHSEPDPEAFLAVLRANAGNVRQTAAALGISRARAYRLMEQIDSLDLGGLRKRART
jgi:transcriptional regulator of acetoin/glycerol metabolism